MYGHLTEKNWIINLFQDWVGQDAGSITSEICGFVVVLSGTILLHVTKDYDTPRGAFTDCAIVTLN